MQLDFFTNNNDITEVTLCANPEEYDYFHQIIFRKDGTMVISDGGCQCIYGIVEGDYEIEVINQNTMVFKFFNLILLDPYDDNIEFSKIDPFEVSANKKIIDHRFYPPYTKEEHAYSISYDFDYDPLVVFRDNCFKYASKYSPKTEKEQLSMFNYDPDRYAKNGISLNALETRFYLSLDEKILTS